MIQIDMPMPKNCLDCPACNEYLMCAIPVNGRKWGENDVHEFGQGRPEWCPMKEQEAIEPVLEQGSMVCGECGHDVIVQRLINDEVFDEKVSYCPACGRSVKWG